MADLPELSGALHEFVAGDNEGGKIGQAVVRPILDQGFDRCCTTAIKTRAARGPASGAFAATAAQILAVEVKQRAFSGPTCCSLPSVCTRSAFIAGSSPRSPQASAPCSRSSCTSRPAV